MMLLKENSGTEFICNKFCKVHFNNVSLRISSSPLSFSRFQAAILSVQVFSSAVLIVALK